MLNKTLKKIFFIAVLFSVSCVSLTAQICPSINAQVATGPSTNICNGACATLVASVQAINQTNTYVCTSIPYYSYPYTGGSLAVDQVDDGFGPVINLPFNFCYWGNSYNQLVVSSNGYLNFNVANANGFSNWLITTALPNVVDLPGNSICGPFRDDVTDNVNYVHWYITGTAPCRALVVYWDNTPFFACTNQFEAFQIVLFESTNIIDVLIQTSPNCGTWNNGYGIIGVQNAAGNQAVVAPGRNFPASWSTTNEAWRFSPAGPTTYTVNWDGPTGPVGNGLTVTVCPSVTTQYTATAIMGCNGPASYTSVVQVSVVPGPSLTVNEPTICLNSQGTFTATGSTPNSTYTWTPGNVNGQSVSFSPSVTTNYTVVSTSSLGCISTATSAINVVTTTPVSITAPFNLCQGAVANFSATANGAVAYQWFGPNGFSSTTQTNTINNIQPNATGNYSVQALFSMGTVSCSTSNFQPINVVAVPAVVTIPTITVCERESANFTASAPNALSYLWNGPNSFTMNSPNPMFTNLTTGMSGIYTVTASFSNGNITCFNSGVTDLIVKPIIPFNLGPDKRLCTNADLLLIGPTGGTGYNWWGSTSFTSSTQSLFVPQLNNSNSGIYVLEVDLNGCKTFDSINVEVLTQVIFTLTPSNRTICRGEPVQFVVGAAQGSENYAYNWNPAVYITSPTGSVQSGTPLGTTIYNISVYDIACPDYVIQTNFTLTVDQPPVPNFSIPKNNMCEPLCMILNSHIGSQSEQVSYNFDDGTKVEGDSVNVCLSAGVHYVSIVATGTNGCKGTLNYNSPIVVYPKPGADFSWTPETPTTADNQVTFIPSVRNGTVFNYSWVFSNSTNVIRVDTSTSRIAVKTYENNGKFPVMLSVSNDYGCVDTVFKIVIINEDVSIYIPNTFTPNDDGVNDVFGVKGLGLKPEGFLMEIYDRWGEMVFSTKDINKGWDGTYKGTRSPEGVYIYSVKVIGGNNIGKKEFKGHVSLLK